MGLPSRINELIQHFTQHIVSFKGSNYNETRARIEFIDPFFKELGWDIENTQGFAEAYKDVIHEDAIKVEGSTKAPDYSFRIGGQRKFFLEAKKPSVNVKEDIGPAYQLRRYAWNAGLPVSILTDFEEFAVYDTTVRPNPKDKASTARIFYCTFDEYEKNWDYISSIFSKQAILKGSFDQFLKDGKKKKGTTAVDKEFLREMEKWRNDLAKNIALRNPNFVETQNLTSPEGLNYVVQATIDRILFLRICEDRNIEEYGRLKKLAVSANIYKNLTELFKQADDKYNSGLFHFHKEKENPSAPDEISPGIKIDDKILKEIIAALYYPSPYEFSVISADILGNVYEQFLGKVIRLTAGGQAKVEEKPEVKKAGGVYYTPQYIVKYIVENTVGELLKGKTPMMVAGKVKGHNPLRILDPACGSGSFLIYAYQYLLDWHRDWYAEQISGGRETQNFASQRNSASLREKNKWENAVYQGPGGHWYLTTREKKAILTNNIFGVDIDHQAVEVTKLNLLLKVLEGENRETLGTNLKLFQERALPDLSQNIKCGNSLIASDFYALTPGPSPKGRGEQRALFEITDEEKYKVNAFDWDKEFPDIFKVGGFDAIIGNPPYVRQEILGETFKNYAQKKYKTFAGTADLYTYFIEQGFNLLHSSGIFSYIVQNKWFHAEYGKTLRHFLRDKGVSEIVNFGELPVFPGATTYTCILTIQPQNNKKSVSVSNIQNLDFQDLRKYAMEIGYHVDNSNLKESGWYLTEKTTNQLVSKLTKSGISLKQYVGKNIYRGIMTGYNPAFIIDNATRLKLIKEHKSSNEIIFPFASGDETRRYSLNWAGRYIIFTRRNIDIEKYPAIYNYLKDFQKHLQPKRSKEDKEGRKPGKYKWYEIQDSTAYFSEFHKPKIVYGQFQIMPHFCYSEDVLYLGSNHYMIVLKSENDLWLLALLNSKVYHFYMKNSTNSIQGHTLTSQKSKIVDFPISIPESRLKSQLIEKIREINNLNVNLKDVKSPDENVRIKRQIDNADREIDRLVYELYGLTEEEIKIVEGSSK